MFSFISFTGQNVYDRKSYVGKCTKKFTKAKSNLDAYMYSLPTGGG